MEEKIDIANDFASYTDSSVTVDNESSPNSNSEDQTLTSDTVDKSTEPDSDMTIKTTEPPKEVSEENTSSSLKNESYQQEDRSSSKPKQASKEESSSQEEGEYIQDDDALMVLNEKYGTNYDNLDDLLDDLEKEEEGQDFANERIAKLNQFVSETGRSAEDFFKTQTQNYEEMSDEGIIKEYLSIENPDLSKEEIDLFFDNTYKVNEDKYSSDETKLGKIHLKRDVGRAREQLQEYQEKYWSPIEQEGPTEAEQKEIAEQREGFYDAMDNELDDIESLSFEINDKGETFDYKLTDEDKQIVGEALSNLDDFFDPYVDDDGNWNLESLALDMIAMKLQPKIVRSVANQYKSQGREQVIRQIKNPSFEPSKVSPSSKGDSVIKQIGSQIFGDSTMWD